MVNDLRGQQPQAQSLCHVGFVQAKGFGQQPADIIELAPVEELLPAECPHQSKRKGLRFIGADAGHDDFVPCGNGSELDGDDNLHP